MDISGFLGIAIVGAFLSVVIQIIKTKFGTGSGKTKLITIFLSIVFGGIFVYLQSTPFFETVVGVLAAASTVYAFVLKK